MKQITRDRKQLEKRLAELEKRYEEITEELINERESITSDENENLHYILVEREFILKQINSLKKRIQKLTIIHEQNESIPQSVSLGTCVKLKNHSHDIEVCLVDSSQAEPMNGLISVLSPIGQAILGKSLGDRVVVNLPSGSIPYKIEKIF